MVSVNRKGDVEALAEIDLAARVISLRISPDGSGFIFTRRQEAKDVAPLIYVVLDWLAELERKLPLDE